jgi:hypothetical protein
LWEPIVGDKIYQYGFEATQIRPQHVLIGTVKKIKTFSGGEMLQVEYPEDGETWMRRVGVQYSLPYVVPYQVPNMEKDYSMGPLEMPDSYYDKVGNLPNV